MFYKVYYKKKIMKIVIALETVYMSLEILNINIMI